tara:strand:- start:1446 stop:2588 length:1143 start_codon:yes stop_codon:yes gene_type:complete
VIGKRRLTVNRGEDMVSALADIPFVGQVSRYLDGCSCARATKEEVAAIKSELESKDAAIERLEQEIRRKDMEKDNLMTMQKVLQEQISQIRADLEAQAELDDAAYSRPPPKSSAGAGPSSQPANAGFTEDEREGAATRVQAKARGQKDRREMDRKLASGEALRTEEGAATVQRKKQRNETREQAATRMQARARGQKQRRILESKIASGEELRSAEDAATVQARLAKKRMAAEAAGVAMGDDAALAAYDEADEEESVDSDYDYDDSAFSGVGTELLSGKMRLAKVYGQEEPPAAESELEWESRFFVLYDGRRMCHYDGIANGQPVGDRGMVLMDNMKAVEKVLGVDTFVIKGDNKVYLLKLEPHDEAMMRTWIAAISQQLQ